MKAFLSGLILLLGLAGAWWKGWLAPWLPAALQAPGVAASPPAPVYVWIDAKGRKHYGEAPPAGIKAVQADLPPLTVVTLPKAAPEKAKAAEPQQAQLDAEGNPVSTPSRQLRNPALERMGLSD